MSYTFSGPGSDAKPNPGDILLCHRKGVSSALIRTGERLRLKGGDHWSHVAVCVSETEIVEALTKGVVKNSISEYKEIEYIVVHTGLTGDDAKQAVAFAESCVGQEYGFSIIFGTALRFLTPGKGLWFGMNGTEICSGLAAQALVRGWANFPVNPSSMTPADLAIYYGAPTKVPT